MHAHSKPAEARCLEEFLFVFGNIKWQSYYSSSPLFRQVEPFPSLIILVLVAWECFISKVLYQVVSFGVFDMLFVGPIYVIFKLSISYLGFNFAYFLRLVLSNFCHDFVLLTYLISPLKQRLSRQSCRACYITR